MHKLLFLLAFLLAAYGITGAQNFNCTVTTDTLQSYRLQPIENNNPENFFLDPVPTNGCHDTFTPSN